MKCFIIILITITLFACSIENHLESELKPLADKGLFGQNFVAYNPISKREALINVVEIPKANFSELDIENLKNGLLEQDWTLMGENHGFYIYCQGRDKRINLAIVNSTLMFDYNGNKYEFDDTNNYILSYRYYKFGNDICKKPM
ncbi:MAG: hypothetical protein RR575_02285 [Acinetobacter sp.]